ncbi:MAG: ribosome-associated protein YbcJ [Kangiellaceae bacterium]|nr:ribosome-associated protein YbcJ [Kangiellaceae bacterium]
MQKFSLDGRPHITLDNLLKFEGWCESGGMAKQLIAEGNVLVDGKVETRKRCKIISGQTVAFNGEEILVIND